MRIHCNRILPRHAALLLAVAAAPLVAQSEPAKPAKPAEQLTAAQRESAAAFATDFMANLVAGNFDACTAAWDMQAFVDLVLVDVKASSKKVDAFRSGLLDRKPEMIERICAQWQASAPKFKSIVVVAGEPMARMRFIGEEGISFVDLVLRADGKNWRIVNLHNRSLGMDMAGQMRSISLVMLATLDRGILERLFGAGVDMADVKAIRTMSAGTQSGDWQQVLELYRKLPEALRNTAVATMHYINALGQSGEDADYIKALEEAAARFPAPLFRFAQVDAHYLNKSWDKAIRVLDEFVAALGRDAALLSLRADIMCQAGQTEAGKKVLLEALAMEPDCEYVHVNGVGVLLLAKDWPGVCRSMQFLEKNCGYEFRGNMEDEMWAEFLEAPDSKPWR